MAGDAYKTFREEAEWRREAVKTIWPELYADLAQLDTPRKAWGCALGAHLRDNGGRRYEPVVGRIWLNGPPACGSCLAKSSDRPGGYPLDLVDNTRDWQG